MGAENKEKGENGFLQREDSSKDGEDKEALEEKVPYPKSVFFIISNEFCERFSYYGMRTILSLYLRDVLLFSESDSTVIYHAFTMFAYFFPILGAIISDSWLGKFRTILYVSMIYAAGNILLALTSAKPIGIPQVSFSLVALFLIAMGTGGIKPCVSAFGGDQFVLPQQELQLVAFFSVFYFSINAGSLISTFLTPVLREDVHCFDEDTCFPLAFAVPGILMIVSIVIFFLGLPMYKIRKPEGNVVVKVCKCMGHAIKEKRRSKQKKDHWLDHAEGSEYDKTFINDIKISLRVMLVFVPLPIFWACYDQQGSGWTFQATRMDGRLGSWTILPDQMQVINPLLILLFIPLFTYVIYPFFARFNLLVNPLQRMFCGGILTAIAFGISAGISGVLEAQYPILPEAGYCQLRIYNPFNCEATLNISGLRNNVQTTISGFNYAYSTLACNGEAKNYSYSFDSPCSSSFENKTGTLVLSESTGYVLFPSSSGFIVVEDDISKPEDGLPRIRTLIGNPSDDFNTTYYDDGDKAVEITSYDYSLVSLSPGTYKFGNKDFEFLLGGVYTVLAELEDGAVKTSKLLEITKHNDVHMLLLIPQYVIITAGEILFSITGLEFSYSQAPVSMKSVLTAAFLLTSAFGNLIIVIIESIKIFDKQSLDFTLYTGLMVLDMIAFAFLARSYNFKKEGSEEAKDKKSEKY